VRDGPGALRMSCSRSGQGIDTGVAGDGDQPPDWSREPGDECWSLGRRRQTGERAGVTYRGGVEGGRGRGGQATQGAKRRTGLSFWKRTAGAALRGIVAPVYSRGPQTRGDETPEKTQPVWTRFYIFGPKIG
jgi:hypothetical protein